MSVDNKNLLADALKSHQSGKWDLARSTYKKILNKDFYHPEANYLIGILLSQQKQYRQSTIYLERAHPYLKDNADLANALSINYQKEGYLDEALNLINEALEKNPNSPHFHHRKAKILIDQKKISSAIEQATNATQLDKNFIPAYLTIAHCFQLQQRPYRSIRFLHNTLAIINRDHQKILFNLIDLYIEVMKFEKAQRIVDKIIETGRFASECYVMQGIIHRELNQNDKALNNLQTSIKLDANNCVAKWNLSLLHLKNKSFSAGWSLYDFGYIVRQRQLKPVRNIPVWQGESLNKKDILIINEQGLGDEIMFSKFYEKVYSCSALCTVFCDPRLVDILTFSFPEAEFQARGTPLNKNQNYDYIINAGSIAQHIPNDDNKAVVNLRIPSNSPSPIKIKKQKKLLNERLLNIGFSWKAGSNYRETTRRSSHIRDWKKLFQTPNCHFWCLQHSLTETDTRLINKFSNGNITFLDANELSNNLVYVSAIIKELDLVISVDNTITHLAGALGKNTWCLLPFSSDWRWANNDKKSYWYKNVTLLRQKSLRNWDNVFEEAQEKLDHYFS